MGSEATCRVRLNGKESMGSAHCGDGEIDFRGDFRFRWYWKELNGLTASGGVLTVSRDGETAEFELGANADKWLFQIQNPKSRLDKFGLRLGHRYLALGSFDDHFETELKERAGDPTDSNDLDIMFLRMDSADELERVLAARKRIVSNGMIWAVWPKGRKEFREDDIRNYALANGLVDVKVASFNSQLSALKLVIPVALRG